MKKVVKCLMVSAVLSLFLIEAGTAHATVSKWTYIYDGIWYASGSKTSPRTMYADAVRIDLANPNVNIVTTGGNGSAPYETNLQSTPQFLSGNRLEVAVNANFFTPHGSYADVRGLLKRNGVVVSSHESSFAAQLRITNAKVAEIVNGSGNPTGVRWAVAGDAWHLTNGTAYGDNVTLNPRTSVGLSKDKRFLILCVVDGRGAGGSQGATILDMSYWMKDFGAHNAMNLDGGGSSCLVRSSSVNGSAQVLNHPSDGSPRRVGANIGANSVERKTQLDIVLRGASGNINRKYKVGSNAWKATWQSLGKPACGTASDPTCVSRKPGLIQVFVVGSDGNVYTKKFVNGSGWDSSWASIGGDTMVSVDACSMNHNRIDVFARSSSDNRLKQRTWTEEDGWGDWINRGGTLTSDPAAVSWGPDRIDIFVRNENGKLAQLVFDESWGSWYEHNISIVGSPDACAPKSGLMFVFWKGTNGNLKGMRWALGWGPVYDHGKAITGDPGAASRGTDSVTVFAPGSGGNVLSRYWTPRGSWGNWFVGAGEDMDTPGGVDACSWSNDAGTHQGSH